MNCSLFPNSSSVQVLLLGGGYALSALAQILEKESFVITSRKPSRVEHFRSLGYLAEQADLAVLPTLVSLFEKYPAVNLVIDSIPPLGADEPEMRLIYAPYLALLEQARVKRTFFLSSTGVYGQCQGENVDEESATIPSSDSGRKRLVCEDLYRSSSPDSTAFRISGIYGPGRGLIPRLRDGSYELVDGYDGWSNRVHVEDIAGVLKTAVSMSGPLPKVLNLTDDEPALLSEVVKYYCRKLQIPSPGHISKQEAERKGRFRFLSSKRVSNRLLHETLHYTFKYPNYRSAFE